jgi:hypothetical protein
MYMIFFLSCLLSVGVPVQTYEGVSKTFRTESITKYTLTFGIAR